MSEYEASPRQAREVVKFIEHTYQGAKREKRLISSADVNDFAGAGEDGARAEGEESSGGVNCGRRREAGKRTVETSSGIGEIRV